jgi:hypothetical protein
VHVSDLIRAHEGNDDFNSSDPSRIHWGKFNMMGRFISSTTQCQIQCRNSSDYDFPERPQVHELLFKRPVMSDQVGSLYFSLIYTFSSFLKMQKSRIGATEAEIEVPLRRLFFW